MKLTVSVSDARFGLAADLYIDGIAAQVAMPGAIGCRASGIQGRSIKRVTHLFSCLLLMALPAAAVAQQTEEGRDCTSRETRLAERSGSISAGTPTAGYHGIAYGSTISTATGADGWADFPVVKAVYCDSPAHQAGLSVDDVILSVNGEDARKPGVLAPTEPGMVFVLRIRRDGELLEFTVESIRRPKAW